jgi:hypothetical protein
MTVKFEKRHLVALADVFKNNSSEFSKGRNQVFEALVVMLKADNPKFNEKLFRQAAKSK